MASSPQLWTTYAVVFDLEFTAWEGCMANRWMRPGQYQEVVQIGAVKVDRRFETGETLDLIVRPRLNPVLSPYLEKLTGLSNRDVLERGIDFADAYRRFLAFAAGLPVIAFGRDDAVLLDNLRLYGLGALPPLPPYLNIIPWMAEQGIDMRGLHACESGPAVGVPFDGHQHNGLADALSVAAAIRTLIARGAPPPSP